MRLLSRDPSFRSRDYLFIYQFNYQRQKAYRSNRRGPLLHAAAICMELVMNDHVSSFDQYTKGPVIAVAQRKENKSTAKTRALQLSDPSIGTNSIKTHFNDADPYRFYEMLCSRFISGIFHEY